MSGTAFPCKLKTCAAGLLASCSLFVWGALAAEAAELGGDSTTILRTRVTADDKNLIPLYEYLHLSGSDAVKDGTVSIFLGGWARGDLQDNTTGQNTNGDLQYGFLNYRANKNNFNLNGGRQFVNEGVASERVDGLYARGDLAYGFTLSGFLGAPVETEPNTQPPLEQGSLIFGGRVGWGYQSYFWVGLSALKENNDGDHLREEEGIDLWLRPLQQIDIAGLSAYNSLTHGWMEHAYTASFTPLDWLRASFALQQINYEHYFHHVTTSALALTPTGIINPGEKDFSLGGTIGVTPMKTLTLSADYKHHEYDLQGDANYYGGTVSYLATDTLSTGLSVHSMNGANRLLKYMEYHAYATQKWGKADFTLDFFDVDFDQSINGQANTYSFSALAGWNFNPNLRVAADLDYMRTIDYNNDVRGLIKVIYAFGSERRSQ